MKAYLTFSQLFFNSHVMNFFFRKQAKENLFEFLEKYEVSKNLKTFEDLSELIEDKFDEDLDAFEEFCYENSAENIHEFLYDE